MALRWRGAGAKGPFAPSSQTDQGSIGSEVKAGRGCVPSPPPSTLDGPGDLTSAPVSILREERRPTNTTTSQVPRHSSFLGQDLTMGQGAWLNWLPARSHQAQLLHKKNGAPAPGVGLASGKGPRYGYRDSIPPPPFLGVQENSLPFQGPP